MTPLEQLHNIAKHPPRLDGSYRSAQRWQDYEDRCRELERQIPGEE